MQIRMQRGLSLAIIMATLFLTSPLGVRADARLQAEQEVPGHWKAEWPKTDFKRSLVDFSEIFSGGPPKDGIPAIDNPVFESVDAAGTAAPGPTEPVMSLAIAGDARTYPLRILIWHEIVNDTVGGTPVSVTFCPLCNSGVVFHRQVAGEETTFGTTGRLRNSDLVMYDRATESWWQQFVGRAIVGLRAGTELERIPARLESYADFTARHPAGKVLVPNGRHLRDYGRNPYAGYDRSPKPFLYTGDYTGPGRPLMRVVSVPGANQAWSMELVKQQGEIRAIGTPIGDLLLSWKDGQNSALDTSTISEGRDVGTVVVQRRTVAGALQDVVYDVPFAFAFNAFHPDAPIHHVD